MKNCSLIEAWNNLDDEELATFIRFLNLSDAIRNHMFDVLVDGSESPGEEIRAKAFEKRLREVEKHRLFKLLLTDTSFSDAFQWAKSSKAPKEYKSVENKLRLIESVVISFTVYARRLGGKRIDPSRVKRSDTINRINNKARKLIQEIEEAGNTLESPLRECCADTIKRLQFMSEYKLAKPLRLDDTFKERNFLYDLVGWLKRHNLPVSTNFIQVILPMIGDTSLGKSERNLIKNIRACEKRYSEEAMKAQAKWI